ncbi:MAG: 50S ribosomal protein L25 [Candidatus Margulisiibacteriota bacterium]
MVKLKAHKKTSDESGKKFAKKIRNEGNVPCIIYGGKSDPVSLSLNPVEFVKALNNSKYKKNQVLEISIEGTDKPENVITKEIKVNPINNQFIHIDFLRINDNNPIEVDVPVRPEGISAGQRLGGVLVKPKTTVKVKCLPGDIPIDIEVDVTSLGIGENIRTENLSVSGSQELISNPKDILIKVESTKISKTAQAAEANKASE